MTLKNNCDTLSSENMKRGDEMKYNYSKLKGRIAEKFNTRTAFAEAIGMSKSALSQRLLNHSNFTQDEILNACELLNIDDSNIMSYFFVREVQKN